jgi:hypothetical protein
LTLCEIVNIIGLSVVYGVSGDGTDWSFSEPVSGQVPDDSPIYFKRFEGLRMGLKLHNPGYVSFRAAPAIFFSFQEDP